MALPNPNISIAEVITRTRVCGFVMFLSIIPRSRSFQLVQRLYHAAEKFVGMVRVDPAHHQHHAAFGFHPGERAARADREVARGSHAGDYALGTVDPTHIPIQGRDYA